MIVFLYIEQKKNGHDSKWNKENLEVMFLLPH